MLMTWRRGEHVSGSADDLAAAVNGALADDQTEAIAEDLRLK